MKKISNLRSIVVAIMFAAIAAVMISNGSQASINGQGMQPTAADVLPGCSA